MFRSFVAALFRCEPEPGPRNMLTQAERDAIRAAALELTTHALGGSIGELFDAAARTGLPRFVDAARAVSAAMRRPRPSDVPLEVHEAWAFADAWWQVNAAFDHRLDDEARAAGASTRFTCKGSGCSGCCEGPVEVAPVEVQILAERLTFDQRARVRATPTPKGRHKTPCPLLGADGRCEVYDVRPTICRTWNALTPAEMCHEMDTVVLRATDETQGAIATLNYLEGVVRLTEGLQAVLDNAPMPSQPFDFDTMEERAKEEEAIVARIKAGLPPEES